MSTHSEPVRVSQYTSQLNTVTGAKIHVNQMLYDGKPVRLRRTRALLENVVCDLDL